MPIKSKGVFVVFCTILAANSALAETSLLPYWKMTCIGSGEPAVNGYISDFDKQRQIVTWVITDKDGLSGTASAEISGRDIVMFGNRGRFSQNFEAFQIKAKECPGGFLGEGFR